MAALPLPPTSQEQSWSKKGYTIVADEQEPPQYDAIRTMKHYLEAKTDMSEELTMLYTLEDNIEAKIIGSSRKNQLPSSLQCDCSRLCSCMLIDNFV